MNYKLGKKAPDHSRAHVRFSDYLISLPACPLVDPAPNIVYPMYLNDQIGDCVVAGGAHVLQTIRSLLANVNLTFTDDQIIAFYQTQNPGFDIDGTADTNGPGSSCDNGMSIQLFLEYLQQNGYIVGFAMIDHTNLAELRAATYIGLGIMCGVVIDEIQQQQFSEGQPWDFVSGAAPEGGHCAPTVGYPSSGATMCTWGSTTPATNAFLQNQLDEAWFVLTEDHLNHPNFRDNFDATGFIQAVREITAGQLNPPIQPLFSSTLKEGSIGPDVAKLQTILKITADGIFGPNTKAAVEAFQGAHGLATDGIVGKLTMAALATVQEPVTPPVTPQPTIQPSTTSLICGFEGWSPTPYQDQGGVWTIGYGATYDLNGNPVTSDTPAITETEGQALMAKQLVTYADAVTSAVTVPLNQNQFDACCSLCYNIGTGGFSGSTVARDCNANDFPGAADAFLLWDKVNGFVSQDLVSRRHVERALFLTPIS